ncbi:glycerol-3-phosphate 1-O-acyltransferase PlsY [Candidatus Venteria ishoeyi]|uniref:glycerol-3-phosphate 1-O-acyltransferase PlsY n=1 Tax=Candidatus Venteria ishoeyi TaxID=1899563 RepID=UPI0025A56549|nr:glycerol-3-phosphate 1-O-acyltransferase PlsY [Candidatus Venteria ishoeyi]MDM8545085.1 glycerol-3-phosphate 1-O-acyltransferase PlsY [Candidatus Venteria ishoeyi]
MTQIILPLLLISAAYLMGSFSAAIIVCRLFDLPDPRTQGSGNPGATNVLRSGGKKAAALTLFLDVLKGVLAVLLAYGIYAYMADDGGYAQLVIALTALAVFLGHLFPVFFEFKGGKGVATGFGALATLSPAAGGLMFITWVVMAVLFRYSSLAALTTAAMVPLYMYIVTESLPYTSITALISILLFWRHRSNIHKLINGLEDKIGHKKSA